jgi:hypothetical protein
MASFIPIAPCLPFADDLHGVEHEDGYFSMTFGHRKVPGCEIIKKTNSEDDRTSRKNGSMQKQSKPTMFHIETVKDAPKRNNISISQFTLNCVHKRWLGGPFY